MRTVLRTFLYVFSAPSDLFAVLLALLVRVAWGTNMRTARGCLLVFTREDAWLTRFMDKRMGGRWGGMTLGHAIVMRADPHNPPLYGPVLSHELIHVEQFETHAVLGFIAGLALLAWAWWLALIVWMLFPALAYLAAMLVALLRGEDAYRGNHLEEAAYDGMHH